MYTLEQMKARLNKIENRGKKSAGVLRKIRRQINKYIAGSSSPV